MRVAAATVGFSLVETLVAVALLALVLVSVGQLALSAAAATLAARHTSALTVAGLEKMEQLRALAWGHDVLGVPVSDTTSDISLVPPDPAGGRGLLPSPPGTLEVDTPGYVDYLDADGAWLGSGLGLPAGSVYVRRWAISPLPASPDDGLMLTVRAGRVPLGNASPPSRLLHAVQFTTIRFRVGG